MQCLRWSLNLQPTRSHLWAAPQQQNWNNTVHILIANKKKTAFELNILLNQLRARSKKYCPLLRLWVIFNCFDQLPHNAQSTAAHARWCDKTAIVWFCIQTGDNPLIEARGLSSRSYEQTIQFVVTVIWLDVNITIRSARFESIWLIVNFVLFPRV